MTQAAYDDPRPFKIYRDRRGSPAWFQRPLEAWWVLTGRWSLHRAWQAGKDRGSTDEWTRIMRNGGDLTPVIDAAIYVTASEILNGQEPQATLLRVLRRKAWDRFRVDRA